MTHNRKAERYGCIVCIEQGNYSTYPADEIVIVENKAFCLTHHQPPRKWGLDEQIREAPLYLTNIHNHSEQNKIDLHTFLYYCNFDCCPICNEWLVQRTSPKLEV